MHRELPWARLAAPDLPGQVRRLGFQAQVTWRELTEAEVVAALQGQVSVTEADQPDEDVTRQELIDAFRAGFRSRRLGVSAETEGVDGWRAIREGHHLQRASFRAGAWFYDEIFPDHVVQGSWVEVFGFRARVQRVALGLPAGASASRAAQDERYAYVVFQPRKMSSIDLLMSVPRAEWVPFEELRLLEQAALPAANAGCRSCGAEAGSAMPSSALPHHRTLATGPHRCGCCGAPWVGDLA